MWQLQNPIYINEAKQIFNALHVNNIKNSSHCLGMSYYVNFLEGLGSNEFHIKWRFGTYGS